MKFRQAYKIFGKAYISDFDTEWDGEVMKIKKAKTKRLQKALTVLIRHSVRFKKRNKYFHFNPKNHEVYI